MNPTHESTYINSLLFDHPLDRMGFQQQGKNIEGDDARATGGDREVGIGMGASGERPAATSAPTVILTVL